MSSKHKDESYFIENSEDPRAERKAIRKEKRLQGSSSKRSTKSDADENNTEGYRRIRLEHIISEELNFLIRDETEDPALEGVHVVSVELSPDYRLAKAQYQIEEGYSLEDAQNALERSASFLKGQLADSLDMKFVPSLRFAPSISALVEVPVKEE
jgi:ribosome-binding factor A